MLNITDNSLAKNHVRYMVGGRPCKTVRAPVQLRVPGTTRCTAAFSGNVGHVVNITLFHYRHHGADYGYVLCGFELGEDDMPAFNRHLQELGYPSRDVSDDETYKLFLATALSFIIV